jgi:hypothetical protein
VAVVTWLTVLVTVTHVTFVPAANPVGPVPDGAKSASGQPGAPFERPGRVDASRDTNEWDIQLEGREPAVEELVA